MNCWVAIFFFSLVLELALLVLLLFSLSSISQLWSEPYISKRDNECLTWNLIYTFFSLYHITLVTMRNDTPKQDLCGRIITIWMNWNGQRTRERYIQVFEPFFFLRKLCHSNMLIKHKKSICKMSNLWISWGNQQSR